MTREEAINILNRDDDSMRKGYFCINDFKAIEVLKSEEPILDKIRAEIEQAYCKVTNDYDQGRNYGLFITTQIINKYMAESEDEECQKKKQSRD